MSRASRGGENRRKSMWVEVWGEAGVWHWTYRDPEEDVTLLGNRTYPAREGAVRAARTAYPGVPVQEPGAPADHLAAPTIVATALGALGAGVTLALRRRRNSGAGRGRGPAEGS